MGRHEAAYRARIHEAFKVIDAESIPPRSPEAAMEQFFALMDAVMPIIETLPRPICSDDAEPDEIGLYRRWRERERRSRHA